MEREDESSSDDDSHGESTSENDTGNEQHAEDTVIGAADNIDNIDSTDANATGGIGGIGDNEEGDKVMTNSHCVPMIEDDNGSVGKGDVSKGAAMKRKSSNDGGDGDGDSGHHGDMGGGSEWHRSSFHQPTAVQQRQKENSNKNSGAAAAAKKQKVKSQVTSPEDAEFGRKGKAPVRQIQWSHPSDNGEGSSSRQEALTSDDPMSNTYDSTSRSDDQEVVRPKDLNLEFDNSALIMKEFGDKYGRHVKYCRDPKCSHESACVEKALLEDESPWLRELFVRFLPADIPLYVSDLLQEVIANQPGYSVAHGRYRFPHSLTFSLTSLWKTSVTPATESRPWVPEKTQGKSPAIINGVECSRVRLGRAPDSVASSTNGKKALNIIFVEVCRQYYMGAKHGGNSPKSTRRPFS
ncbi:hypothetical protein AB5N19_06801 [Seiridium cardinale]